MIKTKLALFQMEIKSMLLHASESNQTSFGISPKTFYAINMAAFIGKFILTVLHAIMFLIAKIYKTIIAAPAIRVDYAFWINTTTDNALQGGPGTIWNNFCVYPALPFKQAENNSFASGSSPSETANSASSEIAFINFNLARNRRFSFTSKGNSLSYSLKQSVYCVAV